MEAFFARTLRARTIIEISGLALVSGAVRFNRAATKRSVARRDVGSRDGNGPAILVLGDRLFRPILARMNENDIHIGERYLIRHEGREMTVKVLARCETAVHSWMCEREDRIKMIVSAEAFLRPVPLS